MCELAAKSPLQSGFCRHHEPIRSLCGHRFLTALTLRSKCPPQHESSIMAKGKAHHLDHLISAPPAGHRADRGPQRTPADPVLAAERITRPRTHAGESIENVTRAHLVLGRAVCVPSGRHRVDEANSSASSARLGSMSDTIFPDGRGAGTSTAASRYDGRTVPAFSHIGGAVASPVAEKKCRARELFDLNYSLRRIRCAD